jgi:hypothetical protein
MMREWNIRVLGEYSYALRKLRKLCTFRWTSCGGSESGDERVLVVESIRSLKSDRSLLIATSTNGEVNVLGRWKVAKGSNIDYAPE